MRLKELLSRIEYKIIQGGHDKEITEIVYDSRKATAGCVFVCMTGAVSDGHEYIAKAIERGATAVVVSREVSMAEGVTYVLAEDTRAALAHMSCVFFGDPSHEIQVIGITGTKGKTTTAYMIKRILERAGEKTGLIGTIETIIGEERTKAKNTTPESYELQRMLRKMVEAGCRYCVMEVSSQGLKMHRVTGTQFPLGIYTNFSRDHIGPDEHPDMEDYRSSKALFFDMCRAALINADCQMHNGVTGTGLCEKMYYSVTRRVEDSYIWATEIKTARDGELLCVDFTLCYGDDTSAVRVGLPGKHSIYNALAAFGAAKYFGLLTERNIDSLSDISIPGRTNLAARGLPFTVLIDYAHNELSMESLLRTLIGYKPRKLICLFGCGGNRDRSRRYAMGEIAGRYADLSILTEDNPRDEEVSTIIDDILIGMRKSNGVYEVVTDRQEAIIHMLDSAQPGDICAIIGKGHEDYQEIRGVKYPFVESDIVASWSAEHSKLLGNMHKESQ